MKVSLSSTFLEDLRDIDDPNFARRVLAKVIGKNGQFIDDADDHRYHGIDGAWIRYASRGNTAFRVIFIRKGNEILLYRAGRHDVEDRLNAPKQEAPNVAVVHKERVDISGTNVNGELPDLGQMLYTSTPMQLKHFIMSLSTVSHKEIYLVSPFLAMDMLKPNDKFGRLIFKAREDGADIYLLTLPPKSQQELADFERLESENIFVGFVDRLHAKLYIFDVAEHEKQRYGQTRRTAAVLGSANLTRPGFGLDDGPCNEELCFRIPDSKIEDARNYVAGLNLRAKDTTTYRKILRSYT